jgi:hypothetical protein
MIALQTTEWMNEEDRENTGFEKSAAPGPMDSVTLAYRAIRGHGGLPNSDHGQSEHLDRIRSGARADWNVSKLSKVGRGGTV